METPEFGNGATLVFGTTGFTALIEKMSIGGVEREEVDTTHLATAAAAAGKHGNATSKPGKIVKAGKLSLDIQFDADAMPPVDQPAEVLTLTWPKGDGETTASIWFGSGYVKSMGDVEIENDVVLKTTIELVLTGNWTRTAAT